MWAFLHRRRTLGEICRYARLRGSGRCSGRLAAHSTIERAHEPFLYVTSFSVDHVLMIFVSISVSVTSDSNSFMLCRCLFSSIRARTVWSLSQQLNSTRYVTLGWRRYTAAVSPSCDGSVVSESNRKHHSQVDAAGFSQTIEGAETTLKRFWKTVGIESRDCGIVVTLDKRALKTPSGNILSLPKEKRLAATLIANEWENQEKFLKQHALPMVSSLAILGFLTDKLSRHPSPPERSMLSGMRPLVQKFRLPF